MSTCKPVGLANTMISTNIMPKNLPGHRSGLAQADDRFGIEAGGHMV